MKIDEEDTETKKRILKQEEAIGLFYEPDVRTTKECIGYYLIKKDLEFAKAALLLLKKEIDKYELKNGEVALSDEQLVGQKSLWFSFIISYGKCFTKANGREMSLNKNIFENYHNPKALQLHEKVMSIRHQYVAHGDNSSNQTVKFYYHIEDNIVKIKYVNYFAYTEISEELIMNLDLVSHVILICEAAMFKIQSELSEKLRLYMRQNNNQFPPNGTAL